MSDWNSCQTGDGRAKASARSRRAGTFARCVIPALSAQRGKVRGREAALRACRRIPSLPGPPHSAFSILGVGGCMASSLQSAALAGGLLAQRSEGPRASHVSRAATTPSRSCRTAAMSPKVGATSVATPLEEWTVLYPPSLVRTPQQQVPAPPQARVSALELEPPSCPYFGPIDALDVVSLERLYIRAKELYYDGQPIMADNVFDELELRLRQAGSEVVRKYPRCSLRRSRTMYADADEDLTQEATLGVLWRVLAVGGLVATTLPVLGAVQAYLTSEPATVGAPAGTLMAAGSLLGLVAGWPLVSTCLEGAGKLRRMHTHALRGHCPHCAAEVYQFVSSEGVPPRDADGKTFLREESECHVCGTPIEFRAFVADRDNHLVRVVGEGPLRTLGKTKWVYGRVYARVTVHDLAPK